MEERKTYFTNLTFFAVSIFRTRCDRIHRYILDTNVKDFSNTNTMDLRTKFLQFQIISRFWKLRQKVLYIIVMYVLRDPGK